MWLLSVIDPVAPLFAEAKWTGSALMGAAGHICQTIQEQVGDIV